MSKQRLRAGAALLALTAAASVAPGTTVPAQEATVRPSLNLYGTTGLIDMPSAEAQPDAQVSASYSQFGETSRRNFTFQILPRLSGTVRYSTINNFGKPGDPNYDLFDRSFDLQFQLLKEKGWQPSVGLGFRDFLGTGIYSAEYLVASKTVARDFTVTGGLGWGRLASVGGVQNPFCSISESFCERNNDFGEGGKISWDTFFHGENMGFFGGVEWRTPIDKLTLKAEVSSDAYTREQQGPDSEFERKSPFNFGAEYRLRPGITLGGYYMYGSTLGFNVVVSGNPYQPLAPQNLGTGPVPINARPANANRSGAWVNDPAAEAKLTSAIGKALNADGITLQAMSYTADTVDVRIVNNQISQTPKAIGRTAAVLAAAMPYSVEHFKITPVESGLPTTTVTIDRTDLENQANRPNAGALSYQTTEFSGALPVLASGTSWSRDIYPATSWAVIPVPTVQIFGGNTGFRPQLTAQFRGSVKRDAGAVVLDADPPARPRGLQRSRVGAKRYAAAGAERFGAILFRLGPQAGAADGRLPLQTERRHLCARVRGPSRARVRRHQRRGAVEAGEPELGARAGTELRGAEGLQQPVRIWLLRLPGRHGTCLVLLEYRLERHRDSARRRPLSRRRLGRHHRGVAPVRQRLVDRRVRDQDRRLGRGVRRGQLQQGHHALDPAALGDAVRDAADRRRQPDVAGEQRRCAAQHRQPALPDRARSRPLAPGAELGSVLAMRKLAILSLLALGACGSGEKDPIVQAALSEVGGFWSHKAAAPSTPPRAITRADIVNADVAAIEARLGSDPSPTLMYAAAENRGYVTYASALQQQVTLHGGAEITGTRGLGTDLLSAWSSAPDPLVTPIPPSRWPARVQRVYELPGDGPKGRVETYDCSFEPGVPAQMTILQIRYSGVQVSETCTGPSGRFENLHFVDTSTGTIWRSLQWVGPRMDLLDLQVLLPYTGD